MATHRKKRSRQQELKNKPVPRTDANSNVRAHTEKIEKERLYYAKKMAEFEAQRRAMMEAQANNQPVENLSHVD